MTHRTRGTPNCSPLSRVRFGPYEADFHTQEFWKDGLRLKLAPQPIQVLEMLVSRPGQLVTRSELQARLWSDGTFADFNHSLNAAVNKLREALCDSADNPRYVETLPRRGYRFIGRLEDLGAPELSPCVSSEEPSTAEYPQTSATRPLHRPWYNSFAAQIAITAGALVVVSSLLVMTAPPSSHSSELPALKPMSVVDAARVPHASNVESAPVTHVKARPKISTKSTPEEKVYRIIGGDSGNAAPQLSPDGRRIAFMSDRSGTWQIWVGDANGSNAAQVSHTESAGTPRWSPDSRFLAFDAPSEDGTSIFVTAADETQRARRLVRGLVPSFSRDGKWVYFASDQSGDWEVWKVPVNGGLEEQVTRNGGFAALESPDGYVYFSKSRDNPVVCRVGVGGGGAEQCLSPDLRPSTWSSWAVTRRGILFVEDASNGDSVLSLYQPARHEVSNLVKLDTAPRWVGASSDGSKVVMNDSSERQISMIENLR